MAADSSGPTQTVLFADVVDSTGLYQGFGDTVAQDVLQRCMDTMDEIAQECGGSVNKRIGDEVLCLFDSATQAASAAGRMHTRIGEGFRKGQYPREMRLRIGFEHGEVIHQDGELFGNTVHTAARLAALAKAGQILTSRETVDALDPASRMTQRFYDRVQLKGQHEERDVHELIWSVGATILSSQLIRPRDLGLLSAVVLRYGDQTIRVDNKQGRADIGRDAACALTVDGTAVSRLHARISLERGQARFEDVSSNGSRLEQADGEPIDLHRNGTALKGKGVLRLGIHCPDEDAALISYECEEG